MGTVLTRGTMKFTWVMYAGPNRKGLKRLSDSRLKNEQNKLVGGRMNKNIKLILVGFLVWLVPFLVSVVIFPLKTSNSSLFEAIMPVVIVLTVVTFSYLYLKDIKGNFVKEGIVTGLVWFIISIVVDLLLFLPPSPMQMSFTGYIMDIGLTYLIIPIITVGLGYQSQKISGRFENLKIL